MTDEKIENIKKDLKELENVIKESKANRRIESDTIQQKYDVELDWSEGDNGVLTITDKKSEEEYRLSLDDGSDDEHEKIPRNVKTAYNKELGSVDEHFKVIEKFLTSKGYYSDFDWDDNCSPIYKDGYKFWIDAWDEGVSSVDIEVDEPEPPSEKK